MTANTTLEPQQYERRVHYIIYRSRASYAFHPEQLVQLVEKFYTYNEKHDIAGLLCYCEGTFVQVLEGEAREVYALFIKIQRDTTSGITTYTLCNQAGLTGHFADWRMALVVPEVHEFHWLTQYLDARHEPLPAQPLDPLLLVILHAFSQR